MDRYATISVKFTDETGTSLMDVVDAIEAVGEDVMVSEASWDEV